MWPFSKKKESHEKKQPELPEVEEKVFEPLADIGNLVGKYVYKDVDAAGIEFASPDLYKINAGDSISFQPEPDNANDKNAIKIICKDQMIGYVHKGKLQGMISDWQSRKDLILASISKVDRKEKSIKYGIAFYKDKLDGKEKWDSLNASLTKTSKKDEFENRQDNLDTISEGDILSAEYDDCEEIYTVTDDCGNELGEFSKSISAKVHEKEESGFEIVPVVNEITESDSGKYGAKIIIYFKPER